ncbi:hypothetical protein J0X14_15270 [Muricauda sp. CAU 1633]|nr:hypothetical protein [Muricauda sp. CAU 1633]
MRLLIIFSLSLPILCLAQSNQVMADTLYFDGFLGVIQPEWYTPKGQRNIFPKNRFMPSKSDIQQFEQEFLKQYSDAIEKHHTLYYEREKEFREDFSKEGWGEVVDYKNRGAKTGRKAERKLKREFDEYNRTYYGVELNGIRFLRIEFSPHKEKWVEIYGAGESLLQNYPPLMFELETGLLSLAGWTGKE